MPFMKKEELLAAAESLGVDIEGLSWPEQQKVVQEAIARNKKDCSFETPKPEPKEPIQKNEAKDFLENYRKAMIDSLDKAIPVQITGEIKPMRNALFKYDEDLGEGLEVDDVSYTQNGMPDLDNSDAFRSYVVKGKTGRKVYAQSTLPRQNAQIYYDPHKHWYAPIVKDFNGREGYLWKHPKYVGIKQLLIDSGYYEDYRQLFVAALHPQNIWMAGGKFFAVNIQLVEKIFHEIEKKAKENGR